MKFETKIPLHVNRCIKIRLMIIGPRGCLNLINIFRGATSFDWLRGSIPITPLG